MSETTPNREQRLAQVFVTLADTLVTDFDVAADIVGRSLRLEEDNAR